MKGDLKIKCIIISIIIVTIIAIAVLINTFFLLKQTIKQNNELISLIREFNLKSFVTTGDKYQ